MAILCLDLELEIRASEGLHEFLKGEWALLFSHPQDFHIGGGQGQSSYETLQREMRARQVRPLVVKRKAGAMERTWIDALDESPPQSPQLVHLKEPPFTAADAISFGARNLRSELLTRGEGFVLIVDEVLRRRGVFKYAAGRSEVSTLDLLAAVDALRGRLPGGQLPGGQLPGGVGRAA